MHRLRCRLRQYRIRRTMWKRPFIKGVTEYGEEGLLRLEELRQKAAAPVLALEPLMKAETGSEPLTVSGFVQKLYRYLMKLYSCRIGFWNS